MALFDVIKFDGLKSRDWLIFKHPSEQIILGSQLIVQEGQAALFVKGGTVCDVFYPGRHTLSTQNLPILNKLVNLPFGGDTPFSAEIYFINTTTKLDITWGTTDPIQLIDPKYFVKLRIRAFGTMGLKLVDFTNFFRELIGGMQQADLVKFDKINEFYRGILVIKVKSIIADAIISEQISALEISTKLDQLSEKVKEKISTEFERYGFSVVNFYIQSINFPDEDFEKINQILEDKAAFEIMGDGRYTTKRAFDVYEGAANNQNGMAGAFMAGGMGFGAGMNMGNSMGNVMGNPMMGVAPGMGPAPVVAPAGQQYQTAAAGGTKECVSCHRIIPADSKFCPECGFSYRKSVCECGKELEPGAKFCPECGKRV